MRLLIQRVTEGSVTVEGAIVGQIGAGMVVLVGITHDDTPDVVRLMAAKTATLRIFDDEQGKMNKSLLDVGGAALVVSQFTLYANAKGGRRPDYIAAAKPDHAAPLVEQYAAELRQQGVVQVAQGVFRAMMQVSLTNDGPVTLWLDSAVL